jgi:chitinase
MYWETSGDFPSDDPNSIIHAVSSVFAQDGLDSKPNHLSFPNSKYDNLRNGMA